MQNTEINLKNWFVIISVAVLSFIAGGVFLSKVWSQSTNSNFPPIIERLVEKFRLNPTEVNNVLNQYRQEKQQQKKQFLETRLDQAVKDGVITQNQKNALLKKWEELRQKREKEREEMQRWYQSQGIDPLKLAPYLWGMGYRHGMKGKFWFK